MQSNQPDIDMVNRFLALLDSPGASDAWHFEPSARLNAKT